MINLYLGTTLFSWVVVCLFGFETVKILENKGYRFKEAEKKPLIEEIMDSVRALIKLSIPIVNLIIPIRIIFEKEKMISETEQRFLKKGTIYKEESIEKTKTIEEPKEEMTYQEKIEYIKLKRRMLIKKINKNRSLIKEIDSFLNQLSEENIELTNKTMEKILNDDINEKEETTDDKPYVIIRKRGQKYPNLTMGKTQIYDTTENDILKYTMREQPFVYINKR